MPIDFPNSPTNGQSYTAGTKTWTFNGTNWDLVQSDALISTGGVTTEKIAATAVTTAKIANDAITTAKIADGAVTLAKVGAGIGGGLDTDAEGAISIMDVGA